MVTIPRLAQKEGNAEIAMENIQQYCMICKKNDEGKSEMEIRKKEADKVDSTGLTCA